MALTAPKQSYNHTEMKAFLSMIYVFNVTCQLCGNSDIDALSIEHFHAQKMLKENNISDVNFGNIYPCCTSHNTKKSTKDADKFFELYELQIEKQNIIRGLERSKNVTDAERCLAVKMYVESIINNASKGLINSLSDSSIRFLLLPDVRNILGNYDLTGCFIVTSNENMAKLNKCYKLDATKCRVS